MNTTKFSPGPWYPAQQREHDETINGYFFAKWSVYDNKQAWTIASLASTWPTEEEDANAFLIAAAPEMYALLERINDMLILDEEDELKYEINSLLAKARGEAKP